MRAPGLAGPALAAHRAPRARGIPPGLSSPTYPPAPGGPHPAGRRAFTPAPALVTSTSSTSPPRITIGHLARARDWLAPLLPAEARGMATAYLGIGESWGTWRYQGGRTQAAWALAGGYASARSARRGESVLVALGLLDPGRRAWQTSQPQLLPDRWLQLAGLVQRRDVATLDALVARRIAEEEALPEPDLDPRGRRRWQPGRRSAGLLDALRAVRDRLARWARRLLDASSAEASQPAARRCDAPPDPAGGAASDAPADVPPWLAGVAQQARCRHGLAETWASLDAAAAVLAPDAPAAEREDVARRLVPRAAQLDAPGQLVDEARAITRACMLTGLPRALRRLRGRLAAGGGALAVARTSDWPGAARVAAASLRPLPPDALARLDAAYRQLLAGGGDAWTSRSAREHDRARGAAYRDPEPPPPPPAPAAGPLDLLDTLPPDEQAELLAAASRAVHSGYGAAWLATASADVVAELVRVEAAALLAARG